MQTTALFNDFITTSKRVLFFGKDNRRDVRPLVPATTQPPPATVDSLLSSAFYAEALSYFTDYPARSLMSDHSRAILYSLIRTLRPTYIAEIGTLYAGTTEVLARACWENNWGGINTTDPFGGKRCPSIIAGWPKDIGKYATFHPLSAMDFFQYLDQRRISLDMTLIDGNHDYEFALFDLQMAARRTRPNGLIIMDNAEQSGPFNAARLFLSLNPMWREWGRAIADHDPSNPFNASRSSLPETTFIILQAPAYLSVGEGPHSWGQADTTASRVDGLTFTLPQQVTAGILHYQMIFRAFFGDGPMPVEAKAIGHLRIEANEATTLTHKFKDALQLPAGAKPYTTEVDISWQADAGSLPLLLVTVPQPIYG
jgi:hypothetical protein